jgi:hypothetical protein
VLQMAGIRPGDPSLYPQTLEDVFPFSAGGTPNSNGGSSTKAK